MPHTCLMFGGFLQFAGHSELGAGFETGVSHTKSVFDGLCHLRLRLPKNAPSSSTIGKINIITYCHYYCY